MKPSNLDTMQSQLMKTYQTLSDRLNQMDAAKQAVMPGALERVSLEGRKPLEDPSARIQALTSVKGTPYSNNIESLKVQYDAMDKLYNTLLASQEKSDELTSKDILTMKLSAAEKGYKLVQDENGNWDIQTGVDKNAASKKEAIDLVDKILESDLEPLTGTMRIQGQEWYPLSNPAKTTKADIEKLKAKLSLDARQALKGSGQISDYESKLLANSVAALREDMPTEDYIAELNNIRDILSGKYSNENYVGTSTTGTKIRVRLNDGRTGTIDASEFDGNTMTKI